MTNRAGCNRRAGTRLCENPCHQTQPSFFSLFLFFFSCLPMRKYSVPYALPEKKRSISCLTANIPADATLIMGASHFEVNEQDRRKVHEKRTPCLFLASAVKISYGFFLLQADLLAGFWVCLPWQVASRAKKCGSGVTNSRELRVPIDRAKPIVQISAS